MNLFQDNADTTPIGREWLPGFSQFKKGESWASTGCVYSACFTRCRHGSCRYRGYAGTFTVLWAGISHSSLHTPLHPVVAVVVSVLVSVGPRVYV